MKNIKTTFKILVLSVFVITAVSCKENKKADTDSGEYHTEAHSESHSSAGHDHGDSGHGESSKKTEKSINTNSQKSDATTSIIDAYIEIKNGLVADSKNATAKGGTSLLNAFSNFDMSQLSGDTHKEYMEILESAKEQAEHIVKSPIDHQREHFETLSTDINDIIVLLGTEKTLYVDYCPMAKSSWLSETKNIKNPYYGAKMMTCGSVKSQIN